VSEDSDWEGVRYEECKQAERQHGDYLPLHDVLMKALEQAQHGKGKERHAAPTGTELPFTEQPICTLARVYGIGYQLGQAAKKAHEAQHLPKERAQAELLGAINYLAAAYLVLGERE